MLVLTTTSAPAEALSGRAATPPAQAAAQTTEFGIPIERVQIRTTKISSNFYTLEGRNNSGALVGPDGYFLCALRRDFDSRSLSFRWMLLGTVVGDNAFMKV